MPMTIGVLALQGAFERHLAMLRSLGARALEVRNPEELSMCDGLIFPGGESTAIHRLLQSGYWISHLKDFHRPLFGTCAGLILMASEVIGGNFEPLSLLDIQIERNAFGRQNNSFSTPLSFEKKTFTVPFIRAPKISALLSSRVKVLISFQDRPVFVQQGHFLGACFHPELSEDSTIHRYFMEQVERQSNRRSS